MASAVGRSWSRQASVPSSATKPLPERALPLSATWPSSRPMQRQADPVHGDPRGRHRERALLQLQAAGNIRLARVARQGGRHGDPPFEVAHVHQALEQRAQRRQVGHAAGRCRPRSWVSRREGR